MEAPVGTIAFVFTSVEGDEALWEDPPPSMQARRARHDNILYEAVERNQGRVFKTIGASFCIAFSTAPAALKAMLEAQTALQEEKHDDGGDLKVRMAIHTGDAEIRDEDYFGQTLNRVARMLAVGHGGQLLLSNVTQELCRHSLPTDTTLKALGEHRLKDLGRPESIFQVCHPKLQSTFPSLRSLDSAAMPNNLPTQLSSFIGRDAQLDDVKELLRKSRLVTLTGAGGCGKTRLSLQVAADLLDGSGDGIWFVELAPLADPDVVAQTVANVFGLKEEAGKPLAQTLGDFLHDRKMLLVLDNCEHLLIACATLVEGILRQCPDIRFLASSREALGVSGEATYRVPSLSLPDPAKNQTPESLTPYESVRLFIERARQVETHFEVTNDNAPALASICFRLDGIPLAIELAAARVRSMSIEDINSRLDQRFRLLTGGSRTALPRQQTLRSLIDWSYDLLNDQEKALLCRLSVFSGGWTLKLAEAICSGGIVDEFDIVDLLTSLLDKNLVAIEERSGVKRYRFLQTVLQYAQDKLMDNGEAAEWRDRHADAFVKFAEEEIPNLRGSTTAEAIGRLEGEHDNFRAALAWTCQGDGEKALRLSGALRMLWIHRGFLREGAAHCEASLALAGDNAPPSRDLALCLVTAGSLANCRMDLARAREYLERCLDVSRALGDEQGVIAAINGLGNNALGTGEFVLAIQRYGEYREMAEKSDNRLGMAMALSNSAIALMELQRYDEAIAANQDARRLGEEVGDYILVTSTLENMSGLYSAKGDFEACRTTAKEGIGRCREFMDIICFFRLLINLGAAVAVLEGPLVGAKLWGAAEKIQEDAGTVMVPSEVARQDEHVATARATLGDDKAFDAAWQEGRGLSVEDAMQLALSE